MVQRPRYTLDLAVEPYADLPAALIDAMEAAWQAKDGAALPPPTRPPAYGRLAESAAPTLVVGNLDTGSTLRMADALAQGIPNAQQVVFTSAAHMPTMEQLEQFYRTLEHFVSQALAESDAERG